MKVVDLFCGCGGMSLGFMNCGFEVTAAFDNWEPAKKVYESNFKHKFILKDLYQEDTDGVLKTYDFNMIIGGPPCQDFSIAGKRNEKGKMANLTQRFAEIVINSGVEWFVMENVYNISRFKIISKISQMFTDSGYGITSDVLDASYLGVPQARKRFFMIGKLGENPDFILKPLQNRISKSQMTVKEYFKNNIDITHYYAHPRSYKRRAVFSVHEPSSTIRGVNRPIPKNYKKHPADKSSINAFVRPLTTKERSQIQTFPKKFIFNGSKTTNEQLIGNAVPVKMAEHVAGIIKEYIHDNRF